MMHYRKGKNVEDEMTRNDIKIENLPEDFLWMHVKGGTAVPNVTEFAKKALKSGEHRTLVWTGYGGGVGKTISCAEILKRDFPLHQITRMCFKTNEEYWEPMVEGLEEIVVKRNIPCVHILLSLDDIDPATPGYQFSKNKTAFWVEQQPSQKGNRRSTSNRNANVSQTTSRPTTSDQPQSNPKNNRNPNKGQMKPKNKPKVNSPAGMEID